MSVHGLQKRAVLARINEALTDTRVVIVNGARQTGKSTLTQMVASTKDLVQFRQLDDPVVAQAAREDPIEFVRHDGVMIIDEVQLAPELGGAIKLHVDRNQRPGDFLLTGSTQLHALKGITDPLVGRMEMVELWPFSQGEIEGRPDRFIDAAFALGVDLRRESTLQKSDYLERAVRGGYPEALKRTERRLSAFFQSYISTLIKRDVRVISEIERESELMRLLTLLAGRTASLVYPNSLTDSTSLSQSTFRKYTSLLEAVFLIKNLDAWDTSITRRDVRKSKMFFVDSGLACHLVRQNVARLAEPTGFSGPIMESFVLSELARQLTWNDEEAELFHYRTKDDLEVDAILENRRGQVIGIEIKAGTNIRGEDLKGLRFLEKRLGEKFHAGYVLYSGQHTLSFGGKIRGLPIDVLWNAQPPT